MQNRRRFLLQTTLAAGSFAFLKPLKTAALSAANSSLAADKLTILNLHSLHNLSNKLPFSSLVSKLRTVFKNGNYNTLLLSTGNIVDPKNSSKNHHIEKLIWLRKAGCDAVVPNHADLENGFSYYEALTNESKLTTLSGNTGQPDGNILPFHVTIKGNIKVGIIGNELLNAAPPVKNNIDEIAFRLNETAEFLKTRRDCNLIVSMNPYNSYSNACAKNKEKELAALTKNIDVIVSSNSTKKKAVTYIVKNASGHEVILNYQGLESPDLKGIDISFNSKMEKINFSIHRVV